MFHLVAFSDTVAAAGTLTALTPVPDPTVTIDGSNLNIPDKYNALMAAASLGAAGSNATQARLESPSLREVFFPSITPLGDAANFGGFSFVYSLADSPLALKTNEGLQFKTNGGGVGPLRQWGLVWLADNAIQPAKGPWFTMRATATIAGSLSAWTSGPLAFDQSLPVGTYDIVGMRAEAATLIAARLIFIGQSAVTRPGVPGLANEQSRELPQFRFGAPGVIGSFNSTTPPSLEILGGTGGAETVYLDLIGPK